MDLYDDFGCDAALYEDGVWVTIEGNEERGYEVCIRGHDSTRSRRVWSALLLKYGERDFKKDPLDDLEDFHEECHRIAHGVIVDWRGDNWIDPETREPMPYSPENAVRLLKAAGGMMRAIKLRSQVISTFQAQATKAAAGNSSRRSGSRRTGSASASTGKSNGDSAIASGR